MVLQLLRVSKYDKVLIDGPYDSVTKEMFIVFSEQIYCLQELIIQVCFQLYSNTRNLFAHCCTITDFLRLCTIKSALMYLLSFKCICSL